MQKKSNKNASKSTRSTPAIRKKSYLLLLLSNKSRSLERRYVHSQKLIQSISLRIHLNSLSAHIFSRDTGSAVHMKLSEIPKSQKEIILCFLYNLSTHNLKLRRMCPVIEKHNLRQSMNKWMMNICQPLRKAKKLLVSFLRKSFQ